MSRFDNRAKDELYDAVYFFWKENNYTYFEVVEILLEVVKMIVQEMKYEQDNPS